MLQRLRRRRTTLRFRGWWVAGCGLLLAAGLVLAPVVRAEPSGAPTEASADPDEDTAPPSEDEAEPSATPQEVVESLHAVLLECMKTADTTPFEERYEKVEANLKRTFDLAFMARASIGNTWKTLSPEARQAWVELSLRYSASKYADNFDGYSGQRFVTHSVEPAARGTMLVKTELIQDNDDNVTFDYRLRKVDGEWRIIDIRLDGKISEITLRRADYRSVIEERGFDALVKEIHTMVKDLAEG